jgi:cytochrome b pre-mRNA-processing protein 3
MDLQRTIIETFVTDMDDNMREMGVGDLSVPRKVKRAAAGLMERMDQYRAAMVAPGDDLLHQALEANIPAVADCAGGAAILARRARADVRHLKGLSDLSLTQGHLSFSDEPIIATKDTV